MSFLEWNDEEELQKVEKSHCEICGEPIFDNDDYYECDGTKYCERCFEDICVSDFRSSCSKKMGVY